MVADDVLIPGDGRLKGRKTKGFNRFYSLTFNEEEIHIIPYPGIHTEDDMIIHFTQSNVVHMGDLLISQSFPSVRNNPDQYLVFLEKVMDVFPQETKYICGHGIECTFKDVKAYHAMLKSSAEIIKNYIRKGKSKKDIRRDKALVAYDAWGEFIPELSSNYWINAVYKSEAE